MFFPHHPTTPDDALHLNAQQDCQQRVEDWVQNLFFEQQAMDC
jgi:hypothetical protein